MNENFNEKNLFEASDDGIFAGIDRLTGFISECPKPTVTVINPEKYRKLIAIAAGFSQLLKKSYPGTKVLLKTDTLFLHGVVSAELPDISELDPALFGSLTALSDGFEIYPLANGNLRVDFTVSHVLKAIY